MNSVNDLPVYDPFQKQKNIGRRTGKVIQLRNGPVSSVEDFFSDSESEVTLNVTRQTPSDAKSTIKDSNSPRTENDPSHVATTKPLNEDGLKNPEQKRSHKQKPGARIPGVLDPFASSRYGRRTGKDVFKGKKKLLQSNGVGNVSDFFTDSDSSSIFNPTPIRSPALDSSGFQVSSHKESTDPASLESDPQDKRKILQKSLARKSSLQSSESSLEHEKENTFVQDEDFDKRLKKSGQKTLACPLEPDASLNDITQNSSHTVSEWSTEVKERACKENRNSSINAYKDKNFSTNEEEDNHSDTKVQDSENLSHNEHHSDNVDECIEDSKSLPLNKDITCEGGQVNSVEEDSKSMEQIMMDAQKKLEDANSHPDFKVPFPKGKEKKKPEVSTKMLINNRSHCEHIDEEDPLHPIQELDRTKSKVSTPSRQQHGNSNLDFGGDITGSVSQVEKLAGKQFFGIRKRLTFSKAVAEQSAQEELKQISEVSQDICDGNLNGGTDMCDDFEIVDNDEIVSSVSVSTGGKSVEKPVKEVKPKSGARKSTNSSQKKDAAVEDERLNQTITSPQQESSILKPDNSSSIEEEIRKSRKGPQSRKERDAIDSPLPHEDQVEFIEAPYIKDVSENGKTPEEEMNLQEVKNPTPLKDDNEDHLHISCSEEDTEPQKGRNRKLADRKAKVGKKRVHGDDILQKQNSKIPRLKHPKKTKEKGDVSCEEDHNNKGSLNAHETKTLEISNSHKKQRATPQHNQSNTQETTVNESVPEMANRSPDSGQGTQISGSCRVPLLSNKKQNSTPEHELDLGEKSSKYSRRLRRQAQPVQYPVEEICAKREGSTIKGSAHSMSEAEKRPEEAHIRPSKKCSAHRKSQDQQKKLSGRRKTNKRIQRNSCQSTPEPQLQPLSMLPRLTPKSGVSFRSRSSCFSLNPLHADDEVDNKEMSDKEALSSDDAEVREYRCPAFTKSASAIRTQRRSLREKAIMNSVKGTKIKDVEVVDCNPRVCDQENENSTVLPSPSSSPVHYQETTMTNRRSSILQVPDFSDRIVHPETSEEGLRRSKRTKVKRLNRAIGEGIVYRRDSTGFGLLVDSVQVSQGAIEYLRKEKDRQRKKNKRKFAVKTIPAKTKRLSSHCKMQKDFTDSTVIPVVNPDTNETVSIELFGHSDSDQWFGPDLNPVTSLDPIAVCLRLNQPFFGTGELHMKPFSEKQQQLAVYTVIYFVTCGKISVTVNNVSSVVQAGDDFFIPRGSSYSIQNLRNDIAKIRFLNLKDNENILTDSNPKSDTVC